MVWQVMFFANPLSFARPFEEGILLPEKELQKKNWASDNGWTWKLLL